jgi:hypothetical protein
MVLAALAGLTAPALLADFRYEQTTRMGGAFTTGMMGMFLKGAKEPQTITTYFKGNRTATVSKDSSTIFDFDRETITNINHEKKVYSTLTFAEFAQLMEQLSKQMQEQMAALQPQQQPKGDIRFRVNETGQRRNIAGIDAREFEFIMEMMATDPKTGQTGTVTSKSEMWIAPKVPGYEEVRQFWERSGEKLGAAMQGSSLQMFAAFPGLQKSMEEMQKQAAKMDGLPVLTVMRYGEGTPMPSMGQVGGQVAGGAAESAAAGALGRLGRAGAVGAIGGLGGFGRKKKSEDQQQTPPPQQPDASTQKIPMIEMTTELTSYSSAPIDASVFSVPAGYKQVESDLKKAIRK